METSAVPSNYCIPSHVPAITHILISVSDYLVPRQIFVESIMYAYSRRSGFEGDRANTYAHLFFITVMHNDNLSTGSKRVDGVGHGW